jgi:hypothetical protein
MTLRPMSASVGSIMMTPFGSLSRGSSGAPRLLDGEEEGRRGQDFVEVKMSCFGVEIAQNY